MTSLGESAIDAAMIAAQLRQAEEEAANEILNDSLQCRPKSTKNCFVRKQQEFIQWATEKQYMPPETVTEAKVLLFLKERVLGRANRNDETKVVGKPTIDQYISALTSLWKLQRSQRINSHPTPRGDLVQRVQKNIECKTFDHRKQTYFDRGLLYQHLLTNEMRRNRKLVADYFWNNGNRLILSAFRGMRNRVGWLLSEQGLCRGENIRDLELPDFFSVEMDNEGPTECHAMSIIKGRGKTNEYGKTLFSGYYRHADVTLCSISSVAIFLFLRYHIMNEPFPDFSTSQGWYDISMFCTHVKNNKKAFSSSAHALAINTAQAKLNILDPKSTHGGRVYGRQALEKSGVEKVAQDVAGGWATGAGEGCYGNGMSRPAMRAMAGFPPDDCAFYLPRACLRPPDSLITQVFPELDHWKYRHTEGINCDKKFAVDGYLRLLSWLRIVLLQDAVVLNDSYRQHVIFQHPIFHSQEFLDYKSALQQQLDTMESPLEQQIQRVLPELCRQITSNNNSLKEHLLNAINTTAAQVSEKVEHTEKNLQYCVNRIQLAITECLNNALNTFQELPNATTATTPIITYTTEENESAAMDTDTRNVMQHCNTNEGNIVMPTFGEVISHSISTVPEVLMEWEVGLNGRPSVSSVERKWKNKWRIGSQNQKLYSRRHIIISMIHRYASKTGISNYEAASVIERKRMLKKYSLRTLAEKWKTFEGAELN